MVTIHSVCLGQSGFTPVFLVQLLIAPHFTFSRARVWREVIQDPVSDCRVCGDMDVRINFSVRQKNFKIPGLLGFCGFRI